MDDVGIELTYKEHKELVNHLPASGEHFSNFGILQRMLLGLIIRNIHISL